MREPKYYKKLVKAARKKNKCEMGVYNNVSNAINEILASDPVEDKIVILKSLIAYFDGKSSNSWFISIMQIAYAILIGASTILASLNQKNTDDAYVIAYILLIVALIITVTASRNSDFERKIVLYVLNDKLVKAMNEKRIESNSVIESHRCSADLMEDKESNDKKNKKIILL